MPQENIAPRETGLRPTPARAAVTFFLCAVLFSFALAFNGVLLRFVSPPQISMLHPITAPLLTLLILVIGFYAIARARVREVRPLSALGLVRRPSAGRETGLGCAVGWAIGVALVLPGALTLQTHSLFVLDGFHVGATTASTLVLLLFTLTRQIVLCGLPFRSLCQATSPLFAVVAFAGIAALLAVGTANADAAEAVLAAMSQVLFCMAAARTRAIWLGTALQLLWGFTVTVLFGLPSFLWPPAGGVVRSSMSGPRWATGSMYGPETALWGGLVIMVALVAVWRLTRDYAWHYTFDPIVGAGYAMEVAPPVEHTRMEQTAASRPAPLVQIGGAASQALPLQNEPGERP